MRRNKTPPKAAGSNSERDLTGNMTAELRGPHVCLVCVFAFVRVDSVLE